MAKRGFPLFIEQLEWLQKITKMLNESPNPTSDVGFYLHVELRKEGTERKIGQWSDEIAPDSWSFEFIEEDDK